MIDSAEVKSSAFNGLVHGVFKWAGMAVLASVYVDSVQRSVDKATI